MKPDAGTDQRTEDDPYATRAPSPESIEALAVARGPLVDESSKARGVGREEFDRGLIDCGFLSAEGLRSILDALETEGQPTDSENLARFLVHRGKLTRYQASALFQGKGRSLKIGPYVVLDKLGSGGMGMVFKARLRKGGSEIALKLLPPSASKHPKSVLRFRREAEIMEKLNHPNVVSAHEIGQFGGVHYLVMDYVEGRDLDRIVRASGPMKFPRAVDCLIQAARGLAAAHERGIVHRDIKPANLLLDSSGVVRVLDLGLARITQGDDSVKDVASAPSLTASGIIMGTVDYLPPEQSDDSKRADHRADIYALGCTLYFLVTGRPPFSGESIMQRLLAHHKNPIPSLKEARPDAPVEVEAIYRRMMAKSPDDRPQSIAEVADSLEAWRNRAGSGKSLRVFNDGRAAKSTAPPSPDDTEPYDLLTFVRDQLFEPSSEAEAPTIPEAVLGPVRRPRKSRKQKALIDLAIRGLVAAAALAVLIRFFPKEWFRSGTSATPAHVAPISNVETPAPVVVEVPETKPKSEPPKPEPIATPKAVESPPEGPPPGPSRLEELIRPPPPEGLPPPSPEPRNSPNTGKKGQNPLREKGLR